MDKILLRNIRVYARHGCLGEESIIGSDYLVNLAVWGDLTKSTVSDHLTDTIDYVHLNRIVKEEMAIPSKLLEHVAARILDRVFLELELVEKARAEVAKINPPLGGDVASVSVSLKRTRS